MLLYNAPFAPNPRRVRIFLAEKGVVVPMKDVDLAKLEHRQEDFRNLNPMLTVPALALDNGETLTESVAICRYFERLHPEPPLFGVGAHDEAFVEMWQRRVEFGLLATIGMAFRHSHPKMALLENPQLPDFAELQRVRALRFLKFLDGVLAARPYIAGDAFTIADITALVAVDLAPFARVEIPADLSNVGRWRASVSNRPSAKA